MPLRETACAEYDDWRRIPAWQALGQAPGTDRLRHQYLQVGERRELVYNLHGG
jgi:hypothetical protein